MTTTNYKQRTREEVMAWLQKARERKDAFQKRANEIFAEEERLRQQAADSHYYDIAVIRNFVPPKFRNLKPPEIGKVK